MAMVNYNDLMPWVTMNFSLAMMMLAIPFMVIHMIVNLFARKHSIAEIIYIWVSLLPLGISCLYVAAMNLFYPVTTAVAQGWHVSGFQYQVGVSLIGFGLIAIFATCATYGFRRANVLGATFLLWGNATWMIYQTLMTSNSSFNSWFWMELLIPVILIICINKMHDKTVVTAPIVTHYQEPQFNDDNPSN